MDNSVNGPAAPASSRRCCQVAVAAIVAIPVVWGGIVAAGLGSAVVGLPVALALGSFALYMGRGPCAEGGSCDPFVDG